MFNAQLHNEIRGNCKLSDSKAMQSAKSAVLT